MATSPLNDKVATESPLAPSIDCQELICFFGPDCEQGLSKFLQKFFQLGFLYVLVKVQGRHLRPLFGVD
jgi:hypothetical protein